MIVLHIGIKDLKLRLPRNLLYDLNVLMLNKYRVVLAVFEDTEGHFCGNFVKNQNFILVCN